ncbi:MAG: peptidase dimerization domain-containing protein, partial [Thermoguttaceae bacterium]
EIGGRHGLGYLTDEIGLRCGAAIIPDGGSMEEITVEEKGILHLTLSAQGHAGHAARPWLAQNSLEILLDSLARVRRHFDSLRNDTPDRWYPTCSITVLQVDNTTVNRIPPRATAVLDIRFPPPCTVASISSEVQSLLGENVKADTIMAVGPTHLAPDPAFLEVVHDLTGRPMRKTRESG